MYCWIDNDFQAAVITKFPESTATDKPSMEDVMKSDAISGRGNYTDGALGLRYYPANMNMIGQQTTL